MKPYIPEPLISIITICYNAENTVGATVSSVLNQSSDEIEYLIIDGLSKDNTCRIIKEKLDAYNGGKKVFFISEKDNGISSAFNKGIEHATGKFLMFLNADDKLVGNDVIESVAPLLLDADCIYSGGIITTKGKTIYSIIDSSQNKFEIMHPASFTGKKVFEKIGKFNEKFKIAMDYDFFLRAKRLGVEFYILNIITTKFSVDGISNKALVRMLKENYMALAEDRTFSTWATLKYIFQNIVFYIGHTLRTLIK